MKAKRKPVATLVWVRWIDASYQRGECTIDGLEPLIEMESAGILIQETEETLSMAMDYCPRHGDYRHIGHIPKVNIRKIRRVQV